MTSRRRSASDAAAESAQAEAAAALAAELAAIRQQLEAHTELLAVIACAAARTMQITDGQHRRENPEPAHQFRDTLALAKRVENALKRITDEQPHV